MTTTTTENGKYTDEYINKLVAKIKEDAERNKEIAGMSGAHHDGGYGVTMKTVNAFLSGRAGEIPEEWLSYARELDKELDPEYAEYMRLKKKFEEDNKPHKGSIDVGHGLNLPGKGMPKPKQPTNVLEEPDPDKTRDWFESAFS